MKRFFSLMLMFAATSGIATTAWSQAGQAGGGRHRAGGVVGPAAPQAGGAQPGAAQSNPGAAAQCRRLTASSWRGTAGTPGQPARRVQRALPQLPRRPRDLWHIGDRPERLGGWRVAPVQIPNGVGTAGCCSSQCESK